MRTPATCVLYKQSPFTNKSSLSRQEKLSLISASKKLMLYFQSHTIKVKPLHMVKFARTPVVEIVMEPPKSPTWSLFIDGSSRKADFRTGRVLESGGI